MLSIVKYLLETNDELNPVISHTINFLKTHKQVNKLNKKSNPFATQSIYNLPAGQEFRGNIFTQSIR